MTNLFKNKRVLFIILLALAIIALFIFVTSLQTKQPPIISKTRPTETVSSNNVKKVSNRTVKNIHWLNNIELAYTFYDSTELKNIIAKTSLTQESTISNTLPLKFANFLWSTRHDLLIIDHISGETHVLSPNGNLQKLEIIGYGDSWSADGTKIVYYDTSHYPQKQLAIYSPQDNSSSIVSSDFPEFTDSLWSSNNTHLFLYTRTVDEPSSHPYFYNLTTKQSVPLGIDYLDSPTWSTDGTTLAYVTSNGLQTTTVDQKKNLIFKIDGPPQTTTYTWFNNEEIIVVDSSQQATRILSMSTNASGVKEILKNISLQTDQRIELALSPDKKILALATEKDGLIFITLQ